MATCPTVKQLLLPRCGTRQRGWISPCIKFSNMRKHSTLLRHSLRRILILIDFHSAFRITIKYMMRGILIYPQSRERISSPRSRVTCILRCWRLMRLRKGKSLPLRRSETLHLTCRSLRTSTPLKLSQPMMRTLLPISRESDMVLCKCGTPLCIGRTYLRLLSELTLS